jgi:hypothetical protein
VPLLDGLTVGTTPGREQCFLMAFGPLGVSVAVEGPCGVGLGPGGKPAATSRSSLVQDSNRAAHCPGT